MTRDETLTAEEVEGKNKKRMAELEKEAIKFEESHTIYEVAKRQDGSDYAKKICSVTVKDAYLASAEPREKRIAELEAENDDIYDALNTQNLRMYELEAQIEKMKCCGNCKHSYLYQEDRKCKFTYCDCINCKDKWELRR